MNTLTKNKNLDFKVEIGRKEPSEWSSEKLANIKDLIKRESTNRTPEQRLKNELLSLKFQMEEYIENNRNDKKLSTIETFLKAYLQTLDLPFKRFAMCIDTTDGNLKKYLSGDRKFNTDLAMKFGHFFHTPPDLWLKVQLKNELIELNKGKKQVNRYKKYDYVKVLSDMRG